MCTHKLISVADSATIAKKKVEGSVTDPRLSSWQFSERRLHLEDGAPQGHCPSEVLKNVVRLREMGASSRVNMACDSLSLFPKGVHACMRTYKLPSV
jgi:hypothetical protein